MDHNAMNDAMREAIAKALHPYTTPDDLATACTAVIDAVKGRLVEDTLNDDHDAPATPERDRAGLRRATRTIREIRRAIEDGDTPA